MKQLTMTKVLTPLAALAFAFGVQAAAVSTDGFETETSTVVTNRTGWSFTYGTDGADDASAITAYDNNAPSVFPDGTTAGSNYLKLSTEDGMLFRHMDGANGGTVQLDAGLYVDTDVQFTITDPSDRPEVTGDDKFIIWLEADGADTNLCVWARQFTAADGTTSSNAVYKLATPAITPGEWHRLTVKALSSVGSGITFSAFQVYLDGTLLQAGSGQYITTTDIDDFDTATGGTGIVTGQEYFPSMAAISSLSKIGFSGEGALDNVVVTKEVPGFTNPTTLTFAWDTAVIGSVTLTDLNLTLTSPGSVRVEPSATPLAIAYTAATGVSLEGYDVTMSGTYVDGENKTVTPTADTTVTIITTAKDTVTTTFDFTAWATYASVITSVTIGDVDVTTEVLNTAAAEVNLKFPTNVTVTVTVSDQSATVAISAVSDNASYNGSTVSINSFGTGATAGTASVTVIPVPTAATVNGQPYGSFADALSAAATAGTATIALAADATVGDAAIAAGKDITIDLAGNDITGAANAAAVFAVADGGTLTITNSTPDIGIVSKGDATACISNAGTLNLQAGKFDIANDAISGGTINVTGGAYNAATFADATLPEGKILVQNTGAQDAYAYELGDAPVVQIVGGSTYTSLQAAIDDATAGDTLIVLKDCAIDTSVSIAKNLTISNDYTIAANVNYAICIGATVTFEGSGTVERKAGITGSPLCIGANETTRGAIAAGTAGALIFNGGTVSGGSGGNLIKLENGTVTMNGGLLTGGQRGIKADADAGSYTSAIVINGGTITNNSECAVNASAESATGTATITINGGVIAGAVTYGKTVGTHSITIPGTSTAQFDRDQSTFCEAGYATTLSGGWYVVGLATYTITYQYEGSALTGLTPASYTIEDAVTLPTEVDLGVVGVSFESWTNAEGTVVASWAAGAKTGNQTFYAKVSAIVPSGYPTYVGDDATLKSQYDAWKATYGDDTGSAYEAAFLLNVDPATGDTTLDATAVTISGTTVTINIDHNSVNGYPYVKSAATVGGLSSATPVAAEVVNGVITLPNQSGSAAFYKVGVSATPIGNN